MDCKGPCWGGSRGWDGPDCPADFPLLALAKALVRALTEALARALVKAFAKALAKVNALLSTRGMLCLRACFTGRAVVVTGAVSHRLLSTKPRPLDCQGGAPPPKHSFRRSFQDPFIKVLVKTNRLLMFWKSSSKGLKAAQGRARKKAGRTRER